MLALRGWEALRVRSARKRCLAHDDDDPAIARFGHAIGSRHCKRALATRYGVDVVGGDAESHQRYANGLGALLTERIVELIAADRVRVPHDEHIGHRATRNVSRIRSTARRDSSVNSSPPSTK